MRIRTTMAKGVTRLRTGRKLAPIRRHVSHAGFTRFLRRNSRSLCGYINRLDKQEDRCIASST